MSTLATDFTVPDLWQQKAINLLKADHDVIVDAPTGSGKTYIFEYLIENEFTGRAVYTVPTRALANDKLREWQKRGWNVGIETGDVSYNTKAPIIVATLETQKRSLMLRNGPKLLVIDEYQMVGDSSRGVNYELAIALAPEETQLLLLSGSVSNPDDVAEWLTRCGRRVSTVSHKERPVPLDEVHLDALPNDLPKHVHGRFVRSVTRVLKANLGPLLVFAPQRKLAESLAHKLATGLDERDPLAFTPEQKSIGGKDLLRCLKRRVAYHHSGMSYAQRAGLVEPLAKENQLKVIVATTGLAAGINFAMRSVLVLDREYRVAEGHRELRPDELLQMFGRAGRRGLDEQGTVLYSNDTPRLSDARPMKLQRENTLDWPSLISVIDTGLSIGKPPLVATRELTRRLFTNEPIRIGLDDFLNKRQSPQTSADPDASTEQQLPGGLITEFRNSEGIWERKRAPIPFALKDTLFYDGAGWKPGLSSPKILASLKIGQVRKYGTGRGRRYGLRVPLAIFPVSSDDDRLLLVKWLRSALRERARTDIEHPNIPRLWTLESIEATVIPEIESLSQGGKAVKVFELNNQLVADLNYEEASTYAIKDQEGRGLLNPPLRKRQISGTTSYESEQSTKRRMSLGTDAEQWFALGLIDSGARPTRRGIITSYFNHGEGLAIAAALEAVNYPIDELVCDLANLRAGHRFNSVALAGRSLTTICQEAYATRTIRGYLRRGLPESYGEGAAEIFIRLDQAKNLTYTYVGDNLSHGDIERARIEWRSLRMQVAYAPDYNWDRWLQLKAACLKTIENETKQLPLENLPPLTRQQRTTISQ